MERYESIGRISEEQLQEPVKELYEKFSNEPEIVEALEILDRLPPHLKDPEKAYHTREHTENVIRETILFAVADGKPERIIFTQAIAAAWHDTGFVLPASTDSDSEGLTEEKRAIHYFKESNAYTRLAQEERDEIIANIEDTQLVIKLGKPTFPGKRSRYAYILDADLSNLGRKDFLTQSIKIVREPKHDKPGLDPRDIRVLMGMLYFAMQLLLNHEWRTPRAKQFRSAGKIKNLKHIESKIHELQTRINNGETRMDNPEQWVLDEPTQFAV